MSGITRIGISICDRYKIRVVKGTHPIPDEYRLIHDRLGPWKSSEWVGMLSPTLCDEVARKVYD